MPNCWKIISLTVVAAASSFAQTANRPASVEGVVIDTATGAPIPRVHVTLRGDVKGAQLMFGAMTTAEGKFSIEGIAPGSYTGYPERTGYIAPRGPLVTATFDADEKKTELKLKLTPLGAIIGRVVDADGEPVEGVRVSVEGYGIELSAAADETGRFRIGVAPGRYRVRASSNNQGVTAPEIRTDGTQELFNATTYFPGTLDAKTASRVQVEPGADVTGIDIRMIRTPFIHVSGRVNGLAPATRRTMVMAVIESRCCRRTSTSNRCASE